MSNSGAHYIITLEETGRKKLWGSVTSLNRLLLRPRTAGVTFHRKCLGVFLGPKWELNMGLL